MANPPRYPDTGAPRWVKVFGIIAVVLVVHMQPISYLAGVAARMPLSGADLHALRIQLLIETGAAVVVLLVATTLSVYKPKGITRYGWRQRYEQRALSQATRV